MGGELRLGAGGLDGFGVGGSLARGGLQDLLAAEAAGCLPVLVLTGNGAQTAATSTARRASVFDDLAALSQALT